MTITETTIPIDEALELNDFKEMDYYTVKEYQLPIELMMENAGLQLARIISKSASKDTPIKIGIGNGNNGGGGLVAARRLLAWGYLVYLDVFTEIDKPLPLLQLKRALKFGAKLDEIKEVDIWVDAYLGFSQRLPLEQKLQERIEQANKSNAIQISLDIPTGYLGDTSSIYFKADKIVTLAASKKTLYNLDKKTEIWIADLGIPAEVYKKYNSKPLPFHENGILKLIR